MNNFSYAAAMADIISVENAYITIMWLWLWLWLMFLVLVLKSSRGK